MNSRTIAIGDIHGCHKALEALFREIAPTPDDTIVVLGDVVDRGPASRQAVDLLIEIRQKTNLVAIQGNHEQMMFEVLDGQSPQRWLQFGGIDTLESYGFSGDFSVFPDSHREFFQSMLDYYETDTAFFTHAAYQHDLPLEYQPVNFLRWYSLLNGFPPPHISGKVGFVGHTANKSGEIVDAGHLVCLDTYCYGGGWLTAMDVQSRDVWQAASDGAFRILENEG